MTVFQVNPENIRPVVAVPGDLDEMVALEVMGWKWMTFHNIPVKGTPGYPQKCAVRQLFTPKSLANADWQAHFTGEATGTEPLAYTYCSSGFNAAIIPDYSKRQSDLVLDRIRELGLLAEFKAALKSVEKTPKELTFTEVTTARQICVAALEAVRGVKA